jgi:hypothetical protein
MASRSAPIRMSEPDAALTADCRASGTRRARAATVPIRSRLSRKAAGGTGRPIRLDSLCAGLRVHVQGRSPARQVLEVEVDIDARC